MSENSGRIIKRYANRKLYDTKESRYVTLEQIAKMIREGEDVKVVDNNSKDELTSVTLAQIIFEEEKKQRSFLPLSALRNIIQSGGESFQDLMSQTAERVGHMFRSENDPSAPETVEKEGDREMEGRGEGEGEGEEGDASNFFKDFTEGAQKAIDDWQKRLDNNLHTALESVSPLAPLQKEIQALGERIMDLERKLTQLEASDED